jgi:hypothetical protein
MMDLEAKGLVVALDPDEAEAMGCFKETAMSLDDALDAVEAEAAGEY